MSEASTSDNLASGAPSVQTNVGTEETTPVANQAVSETSSGEGTPQVEQSKKEELILGKFKSQEDLAKGYQELEKTLGGEEMAKIKKRAALAEKLAKAANIPEEELEKQIDEKFKEEDMKAKGIQDPVVYEMQQELGALKAERVSQRFDGEFQKLVAEVPELAQVQGALRDMYMRNPNQTVTQLYESVYKPVIAKAKSQATQKLEDKAAANVQSTQGSGPETSDKKSDTVKKALSTGNEDDLAKALDAIHTA